MFDLYKWLTKTFEATRTSQHSINQIYKKLATPHLDVFLEMESRDVEKLMDELIQRGIGVRTIEKIHLLDSREIEVDKRVSSEQRERERERERTTGTSNSLQSNPYIV